MNSQVMLMIQDLLGCLYLWHQSRVSDALLRG